MRASVVQPFHNPITGEMLRRGEVLVGSELERLLLKDPVAERKLSISDRTPSKPAQAMVPAAAPSSAYSKPATPVNKE